MKKKPSKCEVFLVFETELESAIILSENVGYVRLRRPFLLKLLSRMIIIHIKWGYLVLRNHINNEII